MALITNCIHYWPLEDLVDDVNSVTLTNSGASGYAAKIDNGYTFTSNDFLYNSGGSLTSSYSDYTINLWAYFDSPSTNVDGIISECEGLTGRAAGWGAYQNSEDITFIAGDGTTISGGGTQGAGAGNWISATTWHMLTFVKTSTSVELYIDGSSIITLATQDSNGTAADFRIGFARTTSSGSWGTSRYMNGDIDEVGVWSRTLSSTEISELYNSGSPGTNQQYPFGATGWTGIISGVTNPTRVNGIAVTGITKINGVS